MFFGLCNSPAMFQTMMNDILCEFINHGKVICYMDNILVYSPTLSKHQQIVHQVLATLQRQRLFLSPPASCSRKLWHGSYSVRQLCHAMEFLMQGARSTCWLSQQSL